MALSTYALIDEDEFKRHVTVQGSDKDTLIQDILNRVSEEIEAYVDRELVTRGSLTEYHTFRNSVGALFVSELRTLDWPIISVTSVHEDTAWPRTYGSDYLLTVDTEYEVVKPDGIIRRLNTGYGPTYWDPGHRAIRVVYAAGYADTASVPARIKGVALDYAALLWAETTRNQFGVSGLSDQLGNYTRFSTARLTDEMKMRLDLSERRHEFWRSGERAA